MNSRKYEENGKKITARDKDNKLQKKWHKHDSVKDIYLMVTQKNFARTN